MRIVSALVLAATFAAVPASAQVIYVGPPVVPRVRVVVPGPPVYVPPPPHVYIRERIRWHLRRAAPVVVTPAYPPAPPVYVAPAPPPPPVYAPSPPCCMPAPPPPPPVYAPQVYSPPPPPPVYYAPVPAVAPAPTVVVAAPPVVGWKSRIGLGVRGTGQVARDSWHNLGIGGEFLARLSNHVSLELAAEYQRNVAGPSGAERIDVPATIGFRFHIGKPHWIVSPYFVLASGMNWARADFRAAVDEAWYFVGQLGGGLELRLGQHFAITADARFEGKRRVDDPSNSVLALRSLNSSTVRPLDDSYGGQFRLGVAVYF
jgi:hypothetical protein